MLSPLLLISLSIKEVIRAISFKEAKAAPSDLLKAVPATDVKNFEYLYNLILLECFICPFS